jgi:hypothetical protein
MRIHLGFAAFAATVTLALLANADSGAAAGIPQDRFRYIVQNCVKLHSAMQQPSPATFCTCVASAWIAKWDDEERRNYLTRGWITTHMGHEQDEAARECLE